MSNSPWRNLGLPKWTSNFSSFRDVMEVVKAEILDKVLVVVKIDNMKCFGAMPNNTEKD